LAAKKRKKRKGVKDRTDTLGTLGDTLGWASNSWNYFFRPLEIDDPPKNVQNSK
jgi:hypothetical protein